MMNFAVRPRGVVCVCVSGATRTYESGYSLDSSSCFLDTEVTWSFYRSGFVGWVGLGWGRVSKSYKYVRARIIKRVMCVMRVNLTLVW